ncbi:hypothetical protein [Sphingomonas phage Carli]|nr:hypothetical protein [Sphingomonas phage Carli]
MLIQSLKTHFPARALEWFGAGIMFTYGYYVVTHPQLFTAPATAQLFSGLVRIAEFFGQPPIAIGVLAILTGLIRGGALFVNGAITKTPLVRLLTAFASAYLWTSVTLGLVMSDVANTGLVVYPWLLIADIVSGYRAGYDLVIAESVAKQARAQNVGQRNERSGGGVVGLYRRWITPA